MEVSFPSGDFVQLDDIQVTTAETTENIQANIRYVNSLKLRKVEDTTWWRHESPIALVGSGPSLADHLADLRKFKYIMACGSAHDFLVHNHIVPTWCVVCDPDAIVNKYLEKVAFKCHYLIASQCSPETIDFMFNHKFADVSIWNCGGSLEENEAFGPGAVTIGGGCTVGTRAIVMAKAFGFQNMHLFGYDSCLFDGQSHAFPFSDPEKERINNVLDIYVGPDKFTVADYMLAQLMDFKTLLAKIGDSVRFTVYGNGAIAKLMELGKKESQNG
jgi:hypothetical protein